MGGGREREEGKSRIGVAAVDRLGGLAAHAGSCNQPWHSDGDHLSELRHFGPHCVNVFVPLVDLTPANGPTEFVPRSHTGWAVDTKPDVRLVNAGGFILFDYRLKHRGLANTSGEPRPLVYITYAKPFFADSANFSSLRYPPLPKVQQWDDRQARANRRTSSSPRARADAAQVPSSRTP